MRRRAETDRTSSFVKEGYREKCSKSRARRVESRPDRKKLAADMRIS